MAKMVRCKACGAGVSSAAIACPKCGDPLPKRTSGCAWIALIGVLFLGVCLVLGAMLPDSPESAKPAQTDNARPEPRQTQTPAPRDSTFNDEKVDAIACEAAQDAIRERLKAPASADFPGCVFSADEYEIHTDKDRTHFVVAGHVDSQNEFGAMLRSRWAVVLQRVPGNGPVDFTVVEAQIE